MAVYHVIPEYVKFSMTGSPNLVSMEPRILIDYTKKDSSVETLEVSFSDSPVSTTYTWKGSISVTGQAVNSTTRHTVQLKPYVGSTVQYPDADVKTVIISNVTTGIVNTSTTFTVDATTVDKYAVIIGTSDGTLPLDVTITYSYGPTLNHVLGTSADIDNDYTIELTVVFRVTGESVDFTISSNNSATNLLYFIVDGTSLSTLVTTVDINITEQPAGYTHTISGKYVLRPVFFTTGQPGEVVYVTAYGVA